MGPSRQNRQSGMTVVPKSLADKDLVGPLLRRGPLCRCFRRSINWSRGDRGDRRENFLSGALGTCSIRCFHESDEEG